MDNAVNKKCGTLKKFAIKYSYSHKRVCVYVYAITYPKMLDIT